MCFCSGAQCIYGQEVLLVLLDKNIYFTVHLFVNIGHLVSGDSHLDGARPMHRNDVKMTPICIGKSVDGTDCYLQNDVISWLPWKVSAVCLFSTTAFQTYTNVFGKKKSYMQQHLFICKNKIFHQLCKRACLNFAIILTWNIQADPNEKHMIYRIKLTYNNTGLQYILRASYISEIIAPKYFVNNDNWCIIQAFKSGMPTPV